MGFISQLITGGPHLVDEFEQGLTFAHRCFSGCRPIVTFDPAASWMPRQSTRCYTIMVDHFLGPLGPLATFQKHIPSGKLW